MSDRELLNMVAQNMIVLKKEFSQLQGAYEAQHDQIALLRAELEEHRDQSRNQHIFYSNQIQGAAASIQAVQDQTPSSILFLCAEDWVRPYKERKVFRGEAVPLLEDIDTFWAEFTKHYVDTNRDEKYRQKWNNLRQKASVQEYTREFQQYSVSLGYSDETLRDKYYDGLKNEIKDIMLSTMFQWCRATAQQVYDKAEEIANHIESTRLSNPSVPTVRTTSTAVPTAISNTTATRAITSIVRTTSGNMPNVRWNGETKDTMIPFPSLKKDERPAAAAPVKPIIAPTPVLASNSKGQAPWTSTEGVLQISLVMPKEESRIEVVSDEEELGKGKAKAD
ncbi:hypothetical protein RHS01_05344 [Rhizoctonia solani]|uniref:Retrotransposon gag domain-containing protein n=1 Tax=Rhizoctonia solani TaxID=456999 RepID=A0A8H7IH97_9AGAM|nr:hypothetical protein RHS01_05344 [Rhizoctonia solani]